MLSSFKGRTQNVNGYGDQPFNVLNPDSQQIIGHIASIDLIENGDKAARENWQRKQLGNLTNHAYVRSEFWRSRIPSGVGRQDILRNMAPLTRKDIAAQVQKEGSLYGVLLLASVLTYETTGSTGTPLKVFLHAQNAYYNAVRSHAQFFFDDLPLDEKRVELTPVTRTGDLQKTVLYGAHSEWAGYLSHVYKNGSDKVFGVNKDIAGLLEQMSKERVGYLVGHSRFVEQLLDYGGPDRIRGLGIRLWLHKSDYRSPDLVERLKQIGIPSLSNYSAAEIGPIAFECKATENFYHVVHSNVIVECDQKSTTTFDGEVVGRLLITHLHSYATPIIRYDIGDFGKLHDQCPCGHNGPTLSHLFGRGKHFLRHPDGKYLPFYLSTRLIREAIDFKDCRFRQDEIDTITVQIGGREKLSQEEEERLTALVVAATDPAFKVVINPVMEIDWSDNPKQLLFSSSVA